MNIPTNGGKIIWISTSYRDNLSPFIASRINLGFLVPIIRKFLHIRYRSIPKLYISTPSVGNLSTRHQASVEAHPFDSRVPNFCCLKAISTYPPRLLLLLQKYIYVNQRILVDRTCGQRGKVTFV